MRYEIPATGLLLVVLLAGCTSPSYDDGYSAKKEVAVQIETEYARECRTAGFYNIGYGHEIGAVARNAFYGGWLRVRASAFQLVGPNQTVWEPEFHGSTFPSDIKLHPGDQAKGKIEFDTQDAGTPLTLRYYVSTEDTVISGQTVIHNTTDC